MLVIKAIAFAITSSAAILSMRGIGVTFLAVSFAAYSFRSA